MQHCKTNCSLQTAVAEKFVEKFCMVGCDARSGVAPKVLALLLSKETASALISGIIVVIVDWKRLLRRQKS